MKFSSVCCNNNKSKKNGLKDGSSEKFVFNSVTSSHIWSSTIPFSEKKKKN